MIIYQEQGDSPIITVNLKKDTIWLTLNQISDLFQRDKSVISRHISHIFKTNELDRSSTVAKYATVQWWSGHMPAISCYLR